ncbi:hypothetical protein, partial [Streptomyces sp. NPDC051776]|uniref:hypothetical protein n=1 Tax=Streptomyces sp. NPDC051776 TaxID=3155414 RepID=UPI00341B9A34
STAEYAPGTAVLRCPQCRYEQAIVPIPRHVQEHAWEKLASLPPKPRAAGGQILQCQGCGAANETDMLSGRCQFCSSPMVASAATDRIVPEAMVPFRVDERSAQDNLRAWAKSRWFAPNSLKKVNAAESLHGTYVPHWTFDAVTTSSYTGERGVKETTGSGVGEKTTVRWHPVSGSVQRSFDDVLVLGSGHLSKDQLSQLEPWPLEHAVPYQEAYVSGFRTLRYDAEPEEGFQHAQQKMATVIQEDCERDIGGDRQRVHSVDTAYESVTYKLLLLPVWFASYVYNGKQWQVMINAETGEVSGDHPYSRWKIAAAELLTVVVLATVYFWLTRQHH